MANPELFSYGFETLTRELRARAWDAAGNRNPAARATAADPLVLDLDATLVTSHSDKENVAGTYKGGYGFAPFIASVDYGTSNSTGEILATLLRPGSAGADSADDHIRVFQAAVSQLPEAFFPEGRLDGQRLLVRTDSAGASRKFLCTPREHSSLSRTRSRRARPTWSTGSTTNSTGNRPWTSAGPTARTRGSSTPPK